MTRPPRRNSASPSATASRSGRPLRLAARSTMGRRRAASPLGGGASSRLVARGAGGADAASAAALLTCADTAPQSDINAPQQMRSRASVKAWFAKRKGGGTGRIWRVGPGAARVSRTLGRGLKNDYPRGSHDQRARPGVRSQSAQLARHVRETRAARELKPKASRNPPQPATGPCLHHRRSAQESRGRLACAPAHAGASASPPTGCR